MPAIARLEDQNPGSFDTPAILKMLTSSSRACNYYINLALHGILSKPK